MSASADAAPQPACSSTASRTGPRSDPTLRPSPSPAARKLASCREVVVVGATEAYTDGYELLLAGATPPS